MIVNFYFLIFLYLANSTTLIEIDMLIKSLRVLITPLHIELILSVLQSISISSEILKTLIAQLV